MDTAAIEHELEDLGTRIDRLRALYEQYFIGIEKIEPQIPRKEVDRKITILRKEQIRNTGLRFKFQMLIQRYNTLQQYWARVTREIENGTFRRDVLRAAARFGEKEALTILGKKRAKQYATLAEAQGKHKRGADDDAVELDADDLIDDDESRSQISVARAPISTGPSSNNTPAPLSSPRTPPPGQLGGLRWSQGDPSSAVRAMDVSKAKKRLADLAAAMKSDPDDPPTPPPGARPSGVTAFGALELDFDDPRSGPRGKQSTPAPAPTAVSPRVPTAPPRAPTAAPARAPAAASPRAASFGTLDIDMPFGESMPSAAAKPAPEPAGGGFGALDVDFGAPALPPPPEPPSHRRPMPVGAALGRSSGPLPSPKAPPRAVFTPPRAPGAPVAPAAPPAPTAPAKPAPAKPAPAAPAAPAKPAPADGNLNDQRIRQIYAKYVEAKRSANESTAGVTYEKLAETLRAQATKLKASHPSKSVDYDVVIRDGKAHLKPVLK